MRTHLFRTVALLLTVSSLALGIASGPSTAAPGQPVPFPPSGEVLLSQDHDADGLVQLFRAVIGGDGSVTYVAEGPEETDPNARYNAIAFNPDDGFIYGVDDRDRVLRIGSGGVWELTGWTLPATTLPYWAGAIAPDPSTGEATYVAYATSAAQNRVQKLNLVTGVRTQMTLTGGAPGVLPYDITYAHGYFWGMLNNAGGLLRISLTGAVTTIRPVPGMPTTSSYGSAWTLGNGMPAFQANASGDFYQLQITDPAGAAPTASVVNRTPAQPAPLNDGTSAPGPAADLSLQKAGPELYSGAGAVTYSFTVTNNGPGVSTGGFVRDLLPQGLSFVASSVPCHDGLDYSPCSPGDTDLLFNVGGLGNGQSITFTVTTDVADTAPSPVANTATVFGNEHDPVPGNDGFTATMFEGTAQVALDQQVASVDDQNANRLRDAGDLVHLAFVVTNESPVPVVNLRVEDPLLTPATITCPSTTLAPAGEPGSSVTCTATYVVTQDDVDSEGGTVTSPASARAATPGGVLTNEPSDSVVLELDQVSSLTLSKTANRATAGAEQAVEYTLEASNTGTTTMADVRIVDDHTTFSGVADLAALSCRYADGTEAAQPVTLAPGDTVRCDTSYVVRSDDISAGVLRNLASVTGQPSTGQEIVAEARADVALTSKAVAPELPQTGSSSGLLSLAGVGALLTLVGLGLTRRRAQ